MTKQPSLHYWNTLPDRDEVLELIYAFIRALHQKDLAQAVSFVLVADMEEFLKTLDETLKAHLALIIEDKDWEKYQDKNLALEIDDPAELDERLMMPEFSGKQFVMVKNETVSTQVGMLGQVTPVRLHFVLLETDELYYIKLQRVTANP